MAAKRTRTRSTAFDLNSAAGILPLKIARPGNGIEVADNWNARGACTQTAKDEGIEFCRICRPNRLPPPSIFVDFVWLNFHAERQRTQRKLKNMEKDMERRISKFSFAHLVNATTHPIKRDNLLNSAPLREIQHGIGNQNEECRLNETRNAGLRQWFQWLTALVEVSTVGYGLTHAPCTARPV